MRTDRPPRLAYLCLQPTVEGQGSHAHVWGIVDGLRDLGWQVRVVEPPHATASGGLAGRVWAAAVAQHRLHRFQRSADAVYVRMHPLALPTVWSARRHGVRVVVEVNGPAEDWLVAWPGLQRVAGLLRWLLATQLRIADHVVTVTHGLAEWALGLAGQPVPHTVIPNGVDTSRFHAQATGGPAGLPDRYAVFVGELAPWQGVDVLLSATTHPDWPDDLALVVAGDGALGETVRAAAGGRVVALGRVPHAQVPGLLAGAAVALVPSRDRAGTGVAPIKLFEALAAGVPVVGSDVADTNRVPGVVLVDAADPAAWARAVSAAADQPRRPGAHGISWRERASQTAAVLCPPAGPSGPLDA